MLPLDPYFTSNGAKHFTCRGEPRAVFTEEEKAEGNRLLDLPEGEQAKINLDITERLRIHQPVTRSEKYFHNIIKRRCYDRRLLAPQLKHRAQDLHGTVHFHRHRIPNRGRHGRKSPPQIK